MEKDRDNAKIPTKLSVLEFETFILPHLAFGSRGPLPKLSLFKLFNYVLKLLHLGCQWKELPIEKDATGSPEIHYTRVYRMLRYWERSGCIAAIFTGTLFRLHKDGKLDTSIVHGDGTTQAAKKGGDNVGYSGHKKIKGDKIVAFCDRNCNVIAPFVTAPANRNESPMLQDALPVLIRTARQIGLSLRGSTMSLDGVYDCAANRKAIYNRGMFPNINPNKRGRKYTKKGRPTIFDPDIFAERFRTIERVFAWEDKFRRVLIRFERLSHVYYAFKTLAYTMINLRNYRTA